MLGILGTAAFLLWCAAAVCVFSAGYGPCQRSPEAILAELHSADQRLDTEYRQARRAMNDAAGQSWRNLAG